MYIACIRVCIVLMSLFAICELGERISNAFDEIGDEIYQMDWLLFPIEMKKMLPLILMNAQQPVLSLSIGSFTTSRETMSSVIGLVFLISI